MDSGSIEALVDVLSVQGSEVMALAGDGPGLARKNEFLSAIADVGGEIGKNEWCEAAEFLRRLVNLAAEHDTLDLPEEDFAELLQTINQGIDSLVLAAQSSPAAGDGLKTTIQNARDSWSACLELFDDTDTSNVEFIQAAEVENASAPSSAEVSRILSAIDHQRSALTESAPSQFVATVNAADSDDPSLLPKPQPIEDDELAEAFLDDASRCITSFEQSLLAYESAPDNVKPLGQLTRELHTLKGAAAGVGLNRLADYLHRVEDDIQGCCQAGGPAPKIDELFCCVDVVKQQITVLGSANSISDAPSAITRDPHQESQPQLDVDSASQAEQSLRVKVTKVDRLMDMLAELVMLRNQRNSKVEQLQSFNSGLIHCVSRLRTAGLAAGQCAFSSQTTSADDHALSSQAVNEVANDVLEIAHGLRELYEPVAEENLAISRFIGQFRHELVELRRVPLTGLFRRLQRAARDASHSEQKQVKFEFRGDEAGIERSLQERLYEPLLHIVRNAVSHGIEDPATRSAAGKDASGTITMAASGGANFLTISISDDGKGLDYDAVRRRGIELGLIANDSVPTRDELAQLIFRPGFSTRSTASAVSGRGVGMDVVATVLESLRSWVEVDSTSSLGTTIRLTIPLSSVIEHVMIFRAGGQMFALPMKFVRSADARDGKNPNHQNPDGKNVSEVRFDELFKDEWLGGSTAAARLLVSHAGTSNTKRTDRTSQRVDEDGKAVNLLVEEIVGPEEVVMRPLPALFREQSMYAGITLAGSGETVLIFDTKRLVERCHQTNDVAPSEPRIQT